MTIKPPIGRLKKMYYQELDNIHFSFLYAGI